MKFLARIKKITLAAARDTAGLAYIEFAISFSVLFLLFLGAVEIPRLLLIVLRLEKSVSTVTDVITQVNPPTTAALIPSDFALALDNVTCNIPGMMAPYDFQTTKGSCAYANPTGHGTIILTDILGVPNGGVVDSVIQWQYCNGSTANGSRIGTGEGTKVPAVNMPMVLTSGEEVIFGEVVYDISPVLAQSVIPRITVYRTAAYAPRYSQLNDTQTQPTPINYDAAHGIKCP